MKHFLDLRSLLKLSGTDVTNHSHLKETEYNKLIKSDPNNIKKWQIRRPASSSSEALTAMVFCPVQIITDSAP